jgi:hypothetical protein
MIEPGEFSGFESMRQLLAWFRTHEELQSLKVEGFHVVVIDVFENTIRRGRKHLVFRDNTHEGHYIREIIPWEEVEYQLETKLGVPTTAKGAA